MLRESVLACDQVVFGVPTQTLTSVLHAQGLHLLVETDFEFASRSPFLSAPNSKKTVIALVRVHTSANSAAGG